MNDLGLLFGFLLALLGLHSTLAGGVLRPVALHNLGWAGAFLLIGSGWLGYNELDRSTWIVVLSGVVVFNLGYAWQAGGGGAKSRVVDAPIATLSQFAWLAVLYAVGLTLVLVYLQSEFGLSSIIENASDVRASGFMAAVPAPVRVLFYLGSLVGILALFPELVLGRVPWLVRIVLVIFVALGAVITLQRTLIVFFLLWIMGYLLVRQRAERMTRRGVVALVLAVAGIVGVFGVIGDAVGKTDSNLGASRYDINPAVASSGFLSPALYISSGVPALDVLVRSRNTEWPPRKVGEREQGPIYGDYNPQTFGLATFSDILKLVPGVTVWPSPSSFVRVPTPTNVYTWLEPWWRDFRLPGVTLFSLLFGAAFGRTVSRSRRSSALAVVSGLMSGVAGLGCFVNQTLDTFVLIPLVVCLMLGVRLDRGRSPHHRADRPRASLDLSRGGAGSL